MKIKAELKNYIEYYRGDIPLILTAPHGGGEEPDKIGTRSEGVFERDDFTAELTRDILEEFYTQTSRIPYCIIARISRIKIDLNRPVDEAYEDRNAKVVYNTFHSLIKEFEAELEERFQKGLYIDIHGQSHPKGYLEFGYLLGNDILKLYDNELKEHQESSSIRTLSKFSKESFLDQLRGPRSMGTLMCNEGYDSIPSLKLPYAADENYFEGAYDTFLYGSLKGGNISGIQIEFPYTGVRDTEENRKKCAGAFVRSLRRFLGVHFDINL